MSVEEPKWSFEEKWPGESGVMGYTMVPNTLLEYYRQLGLTPSEFLILVNIERYRWDANRLPFPSVKTLAQRTGMTERTITRIISSLQDQRGVLDRYKRRGTSNLYSFEPLRDRLESIVVYESSRHTLPSDPSYLPF